MLDCRDFDNLIIDYLDGALCPADCEAFEAHLSSCPDCAAKLRDFRVILAETSALWVDPPEGLHDAIMTHVSRNKNPKMLQIISRRTAATVAAAVLVLVIAGTITALPKLSRSKTGQYDMPSAADAGVMMEKSAIAPERKPADDAAMAEESVESEAFDGETKNEAPKFASGSPAPVDHAAMLPDAAYERSYAFVIYIESAEIPKSLSSLDATREEDAILIDVSAEQLDEILADLDGAWVEYILYDEDTGELTIDKWSEVGLVVVR